MRLLGRVLRRLGVRKPPPVRYDAIGRQRFGGLPGAPVIFVGDSQAQNAPLGELIPGRVANRGIGGQTIAEVASWLDLSLRVDELRVLVVWAGTNDVLLDRDPERAGKDMAVLLGAVRASRPEVAVTVLGIPPLRDHRAAVDAANAALQSAATDAGARFLPTEALLADGIEADGVHVAPAGYAAVAPILRSGAGQVVG